MPTITKPRLMNVEVVFNKLTDREYKINLHGYYVPGEDATRDDDASPSEFDLKKSEWVSGDPLDLIEDGHTEETIINHAINTIEE